MSYFDMVDAISVMIDRWENNLCPDCSAPCKTDNYVNKCSEKPNEHGLCDDGFYLKKIKEILENE